MMPTEYDDSASIGKRYQPPDEIGTPWALTIDHDTLRTARSRSATATRSRRSDPLAGASCSSSGLRRCGTRARRRWQELSFESEALKGNPLGDPHVRPVYVWTPPSYDEGDRRYPTVFELQGFTGMAPGWFNVRPFEQSFPEMVDALAPEAIVVLVDAFTAIGGSQFLDSPAIGNYHTYLCGELVPWVDAQF